MLLVVFILCWNEYLFAAFLTTDHASTLTPWMVGQLSIKEAQVGSEAEEWAHLLAASVLMAAPLLLFGAAAMRLISASIRTKWQRAGSLRPPRQTFPAGSTRYRTTNHHARWRRNWH